jgi:hypothetical protein
VRLVLLLCLGACAAAGCGQRYVEVSGKATVDGKPLTKAAVFFAPDKDNPLKMTPGGVLDEHGVFRISTGDRQGCPPGWYKVFLDYERKKGTVVPSPVHEKYLSAATTPLSVQVVEHPEQGAYDFKFEK